MFINQLRQKIGLTFGSGEVATGGNALKFYSSVRLDIRRIGTIKKDDDPIGNRVKIKVVKNKVAPPFRYTEADLIFGKGIDRIGEIIDLGVDYKLIDKSGSWLTYAGERLGNGRDAAKEFLADHSDIAAEIERKILRAAGPDDD